MKRTIAIAALAISGAALVPTVALAQTPLTYTAGDLFLGVRASGGTGSDKDYLVNLGQASTVVSGSVSTSGIQADLDATFPGWASRSNVVWSISGTPGNTAAVGSDPAGTVYVTKQANTGAWLRKSDATQQGPSLKIKTMGRYFLNSGTSTVNNSTANNPTGLVQDKTATNSYASYQPGGTLANSGPLPGISFAQYNPTIEGTAAQTLELYRIVPASGADIDTPAQLVGLVSLAANGSVSVHPASTSGTAAVEFFASSYSVNEDAGTLSVTVIRTGNTSSAADVTVTAVDGSALAGTDFSSFSQAISFAAGETAKTASISITRRTGPQADRSFSLTFTSPGSGVTASGSATVTIKDVDAAPAQFGSATFAFNGLKPDGTPNLSLSIPVTRDNAVGGAVSYTVTAPTAAFAVANAGTQLKAPTDFTFSPSTVSFGAGETSKNVTVALNVAAKNPGYFKLSLAGVSGSTVGTNANATVKVLKKDAAKPVITITAGTPNASGVADFSVKIVEESADPLAVFTVSVPSAIPAISYTVIPSATITGTNVTIPFTATQFQNGNNVITVTARDSSNNLSVATKTVAFNNAALGASVAGIYEGAVVPAGTATNDNAGFFTATINANTTLTGKISLSGVTVAFKGLLKNDGSANFQLTSGFTSDLSVIDVTEFESFLGALSFKANENGAEDYITGDLKTTAGGTSVATISAKVAKLGTLTAPRAQSALPTDLLNATTKGIYTLRVASKAQTPSVALTSYPQGDGVATLTLQNTGLAAIKGTLADGTAFTAGGRLVSDSTGNYLTVYSNLYRKQGSLTGTVKFDTTGAIELTGSDLLWIRPAQNRARYYPAGWANGIKVDVEGDRYSTASLNFGQSASGTTANTTLTFTGTVDGATGSQTLAPRISTAGVPIVLPLGSTYTLKVAAATGLVTGTFINTSNSNKVNTFNAVIITKPTTTTGAGYGYFLTVPDAAIGASGFSGAVDLTAP